MGSLMGADVGRYASVTHAMYLKKKLTPDLRPYELIEGFFYFPSSIAIPVLLEVLGINPVRQITSITLFLNIISLLAFYNLMRKFFSKKQAINIFFFYSFIFDIFLNFVIVGTFYYGWGILFFFVICSSRTKHSIRRNHPNTRFPMTNVLGQ
jgi:hypothetical protein